MVMSDLRVLVAIVAITILESIALLKGIDGTLMSTSIAVIAGLAGYVAGRRVTYELDLEDRTQGSKDCNGGV